LTTRKSKSELYMSRCLDLAKLGGKAVKQNPKVGAVIVYNNRIIGEGYHQKYGSHHAEVNAVNSVKPEDKHLIAESEIYVSLEPCCIVSKTPACTDLIIRSGIKKVFVGCLDPNPKVAGRGLNILKEHGIEVSSGILEEACKNMIRPFKTHILKKRPYVILKFAQSADGYISKKEAQTSISGAQSQILNHKWRTEIDGILIGTNTAVIDNPKLTSRAFPGDNPIRLVIDKQERIPKTHHLLSDNGHTVIFSNNAQYKLQSNTNKITQAIDLENEIEGILNYCFNSGINLLLIEGGRQVINSFVKSGLWDECRVIKAPILLGEGVKAPIIEMQLQDRYRLGEDEVFIGFKKSKY